MNIQDFLGQLTDSEIELLASFSDADLKALQADRNEVASYVKNQRALDKRFTKKINDSIRANRMGSSFGRSEIALHNLFTRSIHKKEIDAFHKLNPVHPRDARVMGARGTVRQVADMGLRMLKKLKR